MQNMDRYIRSLIAHGKKIAVAFATSAFHHIILGKNALFKLKLTFTDSQCRLEINIYQQN